MPYVQCCVSVKIKRAWLPKKAKKKQIKIMGRELKRVPLDFNAPLNETWKGYLNPHYKECPDCKNGATSARERLQSLVRLILLSGSDSVKGENHPYFPYIDKYVCGEWGTPSADMAELTSGLAERGADRFCGHDSIDNWVATKKIIKAAELPEDWGICKTCEGEAIHPNYKLDYESWEKEEPPKGEGYQLWETTSEGSPQSPVYKTLEELCEWCEDNATTFASNTATKNEWKQMLGDGFIAHKEGNAVFF